jgi:cytochrome c553
MKPVANATTTTTTTTTKLGRWQLHYDPRVVNSKVDQANEDHCGCCHEPSQMKKEEQMLQQKQKWQERQRRNYTQKHVQKYSESEEYYIPYVM